MSNNAQEDETFRSIGATVPLQAPLGIASPGQCSVSQRRSDLNHMNLAPEALDRGVSWSKVYHDFVNWVDRGRVVGGPLAGKIRYQAAVLDSSCRAATQSGAECLLLVEAHSGQAGKAH